MNFFAYHTVAERYAKYRPYFHPLVIGKIRDYLKLERPVELALDMGCGPGQSTIALKEIAELVIGADVSAEMLNLAEKQPGIEYIQSRAEDVAVRNTSVDLITTSMAYHWFEPGQFFAEVRRILKEKAWLVIFNNGFRGQMHKNPEFEQWATQVYEKQYPTPPRNSASMTQGFAQEHGFDFPDQENYQNEVQFTVEELAAYLTTQSNVIAAAEQGNGNVADIYERLVAQARPFFRAERMTFSFGGFIWYLQKAA